MGAKFTPTQGRYLAFIDQYTRLHGVPPAEADMLAYFRTSPPSVRQMILTLERKGFISRKPGQARSIMVLVSPADMPDLSSGEPRAPSMATKFPNINRWVSDLRSFIAVGYDYNTDTFARAIDEGGMVWGGGDRAQSLDELLEALDSGIAQAIMKLGL
jgi:hypothetical protein